MDKKEIPNRYYDIFVFALTTDYDLIRLQSTSCRIKHDPFQQEENPPDAEYGLLTIMDNGMQTHTRNDGMWENIITITPNEDTVKVFKQEYLTAENMAQFLPPTPLKMHWLGEEFYPVSDQREEHWKEVIDALGNGKLISGDTTLVPLSVLSIIWLGVPSKARHIHNDYHANPGFMCFVCTPDGFGEITIGTFDWICGKADGRCTSLASSEYVLSRLIYRNDGKKILDICDYKTTYDENEGGELPC